MSLERLIGERADALSDADRRLVRELLADRTGAAFLSAEELAQRAGTSQATAVRLAQKLGFRGYPELRETLQAELRAGVGLSDRVRRRLGGDTSPLARFVTTELDRLAELPSQVDEARIDAAARILSGARTVYVFGQGHATALVELASRRLRRSGLSVRQLDRRGRDLAERVADMGPDDAVLAFALRHRPPGFAALLTHALDMGAASVVVADVIGPMLRPAPDHLLAASRGDDDDFQSLIVPMAITEALVLSIAGVDDGRALRHLDRLAHLIDRFAEDHTDQGRGATTSPRRD